MIACAPGLICAASAPIVYLLQAPACPRAGSTLIGGRRVRWTVDCHHQRPLPPRPDPAP